MIHAIETTAHLCGLPAIPTHDWIPLATQALSKISPGTKTGVILGHIDEQQSSLSSISASVSGTHSASNDDNQQAYIIQDKLDRMKTLGFDLPQQATQRGLIAPLSLLHPKWKQTIIGELFVNHTQNRHQATIPRSPVISLIPINDQHPGLVLICIFSAPTERTDLNHLGQSGGNVQGTDEFVQLIAALMPLLSMKSNMALSNVLDPKAWLTDREHEILHGLIEGKSVRAIADTLGRSSHTVHDHVKNLHKKLRASSRGELISKALGYESTNTSCDRFFKDPIILTGSSSLAELKASSPMGNHQSVNQPVSRATSLPTNR